MGVQYPDGIASSAAFESDTNTIFFSLTSFSFSKSSVIAATSAIGVFVSAGAESWRRLLKIYAFVFDILADTYSYSFRHRVGFG